MKSAVLVAACMGLAVSAFAQLQDNSEKRLTCDNGGSNGDRARHCEIREQSLPAIGRLSVDASPNGGASIKGWLRSEVLVRARVEASADTQSEADLMATQVSIDTAGGQVRAAGPQSADHSGWSVSYEIFVPQTSDLSLKTVNGGLTISDVRGLIRFDTINGGVQLKRVAGDVSGATVNGGVQVQLAGTMWEGRQLEVSTQNGGITMATPSVFSAHILAETGMGRIQSDFPVAVTGNMVPRRMEFDLGASGPLIHLSTGNGGVRIQRTENR